MKAQNDHSPLRYPGGKASIIETLIKIIEKNNLQNCHYAEPFAGGCGLALGLLMRGYLSQIHINDIDRGIWAFWKSVLKRNKELIDRIQTTTVCIDEWYKQREIVRNPKNSDSFDLGFATFFMNRTNRSGIIKAGVIGGLSQDGNYLLDCRFNKDALSRRIERIGFYAERIHLSNFDALNFLNKIDNNKTNTLACIDPPYYKQGSSLYTNFYQPQDHEILAKRIRSLTIPWILTYDNETVIRQLYDGNRQTEFNLNYSAQTKKIGTELMVFSDGLNIPDDTILRLLQPCFSN
jgi:DNA adenine methylase